MDGYFRRYRPWQQGELVLLFVDTSGGGLDCCAGQFLSHRWLDVPLVLHTPVTITALTPIIYQELIRIRKQTGVRPIVAFERNNGGGYELERLARLDHFGDIRFYTMKQLLNGKVIDSNVMGWDTNTATRPKLLQDLDNGLNSQLLHLYDRPTINEMFSFIVNPKTGKPEAEAGAHDDLIFALGGVWQMYQTERPEDDGDEGGGVIETIPNNQQLADRVSSVIESGAIYE